MATDGFSCSGVMNYPSKTKDPPDSGYDNTSISVPDGSQYEDDCFFRNGNDVDGDPPNELD